MKLKRIAVCALALCAFSTTVYSDDLPAGQSTPSACLVACGSRQAACSERCGVAWTSQRIPDPEYRACMDECVAKYITCSGVCRKRR
jgi:hypothetical protein